MIIINIFRHHCVQMMMTVKYKTLFCDAHTGNHYHNCGLHTDNTCGVDKKVHAVVCRKTRREYSAYENSIFCCLFYSIVNVSDRL